ncbi:hypothetical protein ANCCEY_00017 [Ancylostoma ceylanicum]|uniref:VHS domain-containing protein n=1 Tax=Ancylostoma ceylanicum TaxID=53326 RepID=A0A0D6M9P0_9BILA|nr:hypothetical protein ANCCEY_00017 [Ancylostoma ceylanicum]
MFFMFDQLECFQAWADAFRNQPDLQGVVQVYEELVSKGVTFPATDLDAMAPILTPKQTVFTEPKASTAVSSQSGGASVHELLVMNDEFNSVFEKYDRFMTNRSGDATGDASAASAQPATADLIDVGQAKSLEEQLAGMS